MKTKDVYRLNIGQKVKHSQYGICTVKEVIPDFGPVLSPDSKKGKGILAIQSGLSNAPVLETSFRLIHSVKNNPS